MTLALAAGPACLLAATPGAWSTPLPQQAVDAGAATRLSPLQGQGALLLPSRFIAARATRVALELQDGPESIRSYRLDPALAVDKAVPTADGGLLLLDHDPVLQSCRVTRLDAGRQVRWRESVEPGSATGDCRDLVLDGSGQAWVLGTFGLGGGLGVYRVGSDGRRNLRLRPQELGLERFEAIVADPEGAGIHAVVRYPPLPDVLPQASGAIRIGADGTVQWRWTETEPGVGQTYQAIHRGDGGGVLLQGLASSGGAPPVPSVTALDGAGQLRWRYRGRIGITALAVVADGTVRLAELAAAGQPAALFALDRDGRELWRRPRTLPEGVLLSSTGLRADPAGGLLAVDLLTRGNGLRYERMERLDAAGRPLWLRDADAFTHVVLPRADGSVLALDSEGRLLEYAAADGSSRSTRLRSMALDRSDFVRQGFELRGPDSDDAYEARTALVADLDDAGVLALAQQHDDGQALAVLAADGTLRWRQHQGPAAFTALSLAAPGRLDALELFAGAVRFSSRRAADGHLHWQRQLALGSHQGLNQQLAYRGLPDGRQLALIQTPGPAPAVHLLGIDPEGLATLQQVAMPGQAAWARMAADGEVLLLDSAGGMLLRLDGQGGVRFQVPAAAHGTVLDGMALANGESLLHVRTPALADERALLLLDATGAPRWRRVLQLGTEQVEVLEHGSDLLVAGLERRAQATAAAMPPARLARLRRADGALLWQAEAPGLTRQAAGKQLLLDAAGLRLAYASALRDSYELQLYDALDGRFLGQRVLAFAPGQRNRGARLNRNGQLRVLAVTDLAPGGTQARVDAVDEVFALRPAAPGRVARNGAWYDGASSGQGWLMEVLPASRTLFAAWFTFEQESFASSNAPARLRWYSLQGQYDDGADTVQLDILENRGGRFDLPPATAARKVGSATLRFDGCDSAVLDYRFDRDENRGRRDRVAWRALAIRDPGCAAEPAEVRGGGFSSAASGAWFDPAMAGQGLVGVVQPPAGGRDGLLFAGWFHYDPAGQADDARQQAWLTLQGTLPAGADGRAEIGIFRTLGGELGGGSTPNTVRIGSATIEFSGCERMSLRYRFDEGETAAPYAGLQGLQQLQRLGGCTP